MIKSLMLALALTTSGQPAKKLMAPPIVEATDQTLEKEVNTDGVVLVYFYAPWCSWCELMKPVVEEISREYPDLKVVQLDADKYPNVGVDAFPSFVVVVKGKIVWAWKRCLYKR